MARSEKRDRLTGAAAEKQLRSFIAKFSSQDQTRIRALRRAVRKRLPGGYELVYDYDKNFVIAYGPTDRGYEAVVAIAAQASRLALCFGQGASLPDPAGILRGRGRQVRSVPLNSAADLERPELEALMREALARAVVPLRGGSVHLVIRSGAATRRARQKPAKRAV
jgi:hypothetical protein